MNFSQLDLKICNFVALMVSRCISMQYLIRSQWVYYSEQSSDLVVWKHQKTFEGTNISIHIRLSQGGICIRSLEGKSTDSVPHLWSQDPAACARVAAEMKVFLLEMDVWNAIFLAGEWGRHLFIRTSHNSIENIVLLRHAFMRVQICLPFLGTILPEKCCNFSIQFDVQCTCFFSNWVVQPANQQNLPGLY